jgi:hypothetical protein
MGLLAIGAVAPAAADAVVIDFEDFDLGGAIYLDLPETLLFPDVGGSGIEVIIAGHDDIRIYDLVLYSSGYPGAAGQALIDMNWSNYSNPDGTDIYFDHPVSSFSLQAGDFGSDNDSPLTIVAFDESGTQIGADSQPWAGDAFPPFITLSITAPGIRRIHWQSGGAFQNSIFIDNLTFDPAPPTAAASITWSSLKQLY